MTVLLIAALFSATVSPSFCLDAMKCLHIEKTPIQIPISQSIPNSTMTVMLKYMNLIAVTDKDSSKRKIILALIASIQESHTSQTLNDYKNYAIAGNYLDFRLFSQALCKVAAHSFDALHSMLAKLLDLNNVSKEVYDCIQKACYLSYNKHLDISDPAVRTLNNLADYSSLTFGNNIQQCIISMIKESHYEILQTTSLSIKAHHALADYVRSLTQTQMEELFTTLQGKSTFKMALRLLYAQKTQKNLDALDCVHFINNITNWINKADDHNGYNTWINKTDDHNGYQKTIRYGWQKTILFSQNYLQYVLPLLEPITGVAVKVLELSSQDLTSLPDSICNLSNLTRLILVFNELNSLPDSITNLVNLTTLELSWNQLTSLPDSIGNLINLKKLLLSHNNLTTLPEKIGNLRNLNKLELGNNDLSYLPNSIGMLSRLENLDLSCNLLTVLPDSICNLINVKTLLLNTNKLNTLPLEIGNLVNLEQLNLEWNQLTRLPDSVGNLVALKRLFLYNNQLTVVPDVIGNLINLELLYLNNNQLTTLPNAIGNLVNLEILCLDNNKLSNETKLQLKEHKNKYKYL